MCAVDDGEIQNSPEAPSSCVGPLPAVNGVDVVGAGRSPFTRADAPVAEHLPAQAPPQPPPPGCQLLRSVLRRKEVCGRPEKFQQRLVTPVGPLIADCSAGPERTALPLGGEAAVTSPLGQEEEKVGVCFEQLQRDGGLGVAPDGVVPSADAQNGNGHLVHVSQGLVVFPVGVPAAPRL